MIHKAFGLAAMALHDNNSTGYMKHYLDDMEVYFNKSSNSTYDPVYFQKLETCMSKYNDTLLQKSQDSAWKGMEDYWVSNGTDKDYMNQTDHWGGCTPETPSTRCPVGDYMEFKSNPTGGVFGSANVTIEEPCNYASNVAYYHAATRICDYPSFSLPEDQVNSLKRSFATLAMGSAFWHGSHTYDGYSFDNNMIAVISYLAHQASVSNFNSTSSVLNEISLTPRNKTGVQVSEDLVTMFYEKPVFQWAEVLDTADLPHVYYRTFAALISTAMALILNEFAIVTFIISFLVNIIIPKEDAEFITDHYLPELGKQFPRTVSSADRKALAYNMGGMLIKIGYAFMWQEYFIPLKFLYNDTGLELGAEAMTYVNSFANRVSGFPQTDPAVTNSENLYPGQGQCKISSAHSLWHEESANGLLEIALCGDTMHRVTKASVKTEQTHDYMSIVGKLFDVMNFVGSDDFFTFWFTKY